MMDIKTYKGILKCLKYFIAATTWQNHVYAVGGCCRDSIMGSDTIKDIDLTVDLPNGGIEFAEWLYRQKLLVRKPVTYPTYGTASFELAAFPGETIEAVQTRAEKYPDPSSRNPVAVFGSIGQDCMRRDLTINAVYWDISHEEYLDVCGESFEDLKNHVINTPTDPNVTYDDDPLRILRCARFSAKYMWPINDDVFAAMQSNAHRLDIISNERIREELLHILDMPSENAAYGIEKLCECGAMEYAMKSVTLKTAETAFKNPAWKWSDEFNGRQKENARLAMLACVAPKYTNSIDLLKLPLHDIGDIAQGTIVGEWMVRNDVSNSPSNARRAIHACGNMEVLKIASACHSVLAGGDVRIDTCVNVSKAIAGGWFDKKLPINGNDIKAVGYDGPEIGMAIHRCWDKYFDDPSTTREEFIGYLEDLRKNM